MDLYSSERWILEKHGAVIRQAETRGRLLPDSGSGGVNLWVVGRLRELADRLEGQTRFEGREPLT